MMYEKLSVPAAAPALAVDSVNDAPSTLELRYGDVAPAIMVAADAVNGDHVMTLPAVMLALLIVTVAAAGHVNCPVPTGTNWPTA